jgi:hypothetical protein
MIYVIALNCLYDVFYWPPVRTDDDGIVASPTLHSRSHQLICPSFARADELDAAGQAEGFELAFDGFEAATQVICNAGGSQLPAIAEQFQDPQTPTLWRVLNLNRIGLGFLGVASQDNVQ